MAYSVTLSEADQAKINRLPILKQDEIKARTGGPLTLSVVYDTIGRVSNNRTDSDPQAEKADRLLAELLAKKNFAVPSAGAMPAPAATPASKPQTPDSAAPTVAQLTARLNIVSLALELEDDPAAVKQLTARKNILELAIELA
jgi:hypothetical protein